jgi:hypothetical protein
MPSAVATEASSSACLAARRPSALRSSTKVSRSSLGSSCNFSADPIDQRDRAFWSESLNEEYHY